MLDFYMQSLPEDYTFGVEIECIGDRATEIINYNPTDFKVERDGSLDDEKGIEFISPKLGFNYEDLKKLDDIYDFVNSNGFYVDETCGAHIHSGAHYYKTIGGLLNRCIIQEYFQKELYAIFNAPGDRIRKGCGNHATSTNDIVYELELTAKIYKLKAMQPISEYSNLSGVSKKFKSYGLNIRNIGVEEKNTTEDRISNGTLDVDVAKENISLAASLVIASVKILEYYEYQLQVNELLSKKRTSYKKIELLMNLLFEDKEYMKEIYYERYEANIKDPMLNNLGIEERTLSDYPNIRKALESTKGR